MFQFAEGSKKKSVWIQPNAYKRALKARTEAEIKIQETKSTST